jgi:hypothetical protein
MATSARPRSGRHPHHAASVNLIAFAIRLVKICRTRSTSQRTSGSSSGSLTVTCRVLRHRERRQRLDDRRDLRRQVDVLGVHLEVPGFDARQVEDVVDQPQQRAPVARDDLEVPALIGRERPGDPSRSSCDSARTELSGVRISWLMFATNVLFSRSALSAERDRPSAMPCSGHDPAHRQRRRQRDRRPATRAGREPDIAREPPARRSAARHDGHTPRQQK